MVAMSPLNTPETMVALSGVCVEGWTTLKYLKIIPSDAMAYRTRGRGNMAPRREVERPKRAPIETMYPTAGQPTA